MPKTATGSSTRSGSEASSINPHQICPRSCLNALLMQPVCPCVSVAPQGLKHHMVYWFLASDTFKALQDQGSLPDTESLHRKDDDLVQDTQKLCTQR